MNEKKKKTGKGGRMPEYQRFYYWIEFLHLKLMGQQILLKRKREEVLVSARYARE